MGWWKIKSISSGQIDWNKSGIVNAIPGNDTNENYYNGDGPADIMSNLIKNFILLAEPLAKLPTKEEVRKYCLNCEIPERFNLIPAMLTKLFNHQWNRINQEYQEDWNRLPYPEEKEAIVNFVTNAYTPDEYLKTAKNFRQKSFICHNCGQTRDYYNLFFEENFEVKYNEINSQELEWFCKECLQC